MTGTLTTPMGRASLRFSSETPLSLSAGASRFTHNMSFSGRGAACNASLHAVAEPAPVLETTTTIRRPASLYEVLRVKRNASPTEIKSAYRTLAKVYHPDASDFKEDGRDFIEIHKAYATLSDPAARALYDLSLNAELRRRSFGCSGVGGRTGFYPTRRWETDQCW